MSGSECPQAIGEEFESVGEVVAAGPGRLNDDGKRIALEVAVGDKIIYSKYAGTEYKVDGEEYLILRESAVLAKLT